MVVKAMLCSCQWRRDTFPINSTEKTRYVEQILFSTIQCFERFLKKAETDPSVSEMLGSCRKKVRVKSVRFRILMQKV